MNATPLHDVYSHSADSFRYLAEAKESGLLEDYGSAGTALRRFEEEPRRAIGCEWLSD